MCFLGSGGDAPFPFLNLKVMARRKNTEASEEVQTQEVGQVAEQAVPEVTTQGDEAVAQELAQTPGESTQTTEKPTDTIDNQVDADSSASVKIPEYVQKILASYPNYPCLYIDAKGGVYPKHTQPNLISGAILYQNPYYKQ